VGLVVGGLARGSSSAGEIKRARRGPSFIGSANQVRRRLGAVAASPSRVAAVLGGTMYLINVTAAGGARAHPLHRQRDCTAARAADPPEQRL
jgi:hypothetical protein